MEGIVREGIDIVAIPSERLNILLREYTRQASVAKESNINITAIDMTPIYNWYVDNIEHELNKMALQGLAVLFKFIVEQYVLQVTDNIFFLQCESHRSNDLIDPNDREYVLDLIVNFIRNNSIPYEVELVSFLNTCYDQQKFHKLYDMIVSTLQKYGLSMKFPVKQSDLDIDWYTDPILHLPIKWDDMIMDPAKHSFGDIHAYRAAYPFDKKLTMYVASVPMVTIGYINISSFMEVVTLCTQPVQIDMERETYLD